MAEARPMWQEFGIMAASEAAHDGTRANPLKASVSMLHDSRFSPPGQLLSHPVGATDLPEALGYRYIYIYIYS